MCNDGLSEENKKAESHQLLVLCQLFYPELVSTGQTLTELCEELVRFGVDVEVVCGPPTILGRNKKVAKYIEHKGIRIRRVWGTRFPKLNLLGRVINQITFATSVFLHLLFHRPKRPILVLTNPPFLAITCGILNLLKISGPYIYLVFDVYPDTAVRLGVLKENGLLSGIWERLNTFVFKHASAIVVIGRCMEEVITKKMENCNLNTNGKLHHISVWSDDELIRSASERENPLKKKWELEDKFVVGYFGNMGRFHDMETIINAAEILKDNKNICFLFVGEGHKKQATMEYVARHNLQNCQFHTYVDRQDLGYLMHLADIGIVSLLEGQEGLSVPSKALGLMAAGVPLIAVMSPKSEIARIVKEEGCGIVVKPGEEKVLADSILQLYNDNAQLKQMGANALMAIREKYNLDKISRKYFDLIGQVV
jgi:glycosyltransferase involved in cell wall biosynthesis